MRQAIAVAILLALTLAAEARAIPEEACTPFLNSSVHTCSPLEKFVLVAGALFMIGLCVMLATLLVKLARGSVRPPA